MAQRPPALTKMGASCRRGVVECAGPEIKIGAFVVENPTTKLIWPVLFEPATDASHFRSKFETLLGAGAAAVGVGATP